MTSITPQCFHCQEYLGIDESDPDGRLWRCAAFRDKPIPRAILVNRFIHDKPYPGDHGIRFTACCDEEGE